MESIVARLTSEFPGRDIRHHPGDAVQVITRDVAVEISSQHEGSYLAKVVRLTVAGLDCDTEMLAETRCQTIEDLIAFLKRQLPPDKTSH